MSNPIQNNDDLLSFLNQEASAPAVALPTGGDFAPTGFVGPWSAAVMYALYDEANLSELGITPDLKNKAGDKGYWYFFHKPDVAEAARLALGKEFPAAQSWVFHINTGDIVNFFNEETKSKFGAALVYHTRISGLGAWKNRHTFHMVSLPSAIAAVARLLGYDTPGFPLDALTSLPDEMTDQQAAELIGTKKEYEASLLWKQRAALWAALGEENPKVYLAAGTTVTKGDKPEPSPLATTSDKLNRCLGIVAKPWQRPAWARVLSVPDPRVDALTSSGRRLTIPCLTEIWPTETAARAAIAAEMGTNGTTASAPASDELAVPAMWKDMPDQWRTTVLDFKSKLNNRPLALAYNAAGGAGTLGASLEEVQAWLSKV